PQGRRRAGGHDHRGRARARGRRGGRDTRGGPDVSEPAILFLRATTAASLAPWYEDFVAAVDSTHGVALYDLEVDAEVEFGSARAVVDLGGFAPNDVIDAGADAGVELWQVMGYGLDHIDVEHVKRRIPAFAHSPGECTGGPLAEHAVH